MLRLDNIKKNYYVADMTVEALKGINLCFRKSEFVSILGPSGCGKTTLLNIIGGLDQYTSGDLVINGRSTKEFKDHDWDVYRNHRIGFIFQSYNLIPHQTVLGNVELALTIAGLSKAERVERAKKALDRVGLSAQYYKRPNQMSGGQCQRVAIARALVNEPEILLADEPTGALDTETSVQIMDLIQEIAKEKLVIMVTHNPDLAYKYSTRIVKCLDGLVQEDSMPFSPEEEIQEVEKNKEPVKTEEVTKKKKTKSSEKAKMSLWTAFRLSARNLQAKFKRTFMVALAGCIGIVGVSTVLAVSNGVQNYINDMENDMLSGNPVYITSSSLDYSSIMGGGLTGGGETTNEENDISKVFINSLVQTLVNMNGVTSTNEIGKEYMDFLSKMPAEACELIQYKYGDSIAPNIYTDFKTCDGKTHTMSVAAIQAYYASVLNNVEEFKQYSSMINSVSVMSEMPSNAKYIADQYDVVYIEPGYTLEDVLTSKESLVAVASKSNNTLNDLELAEYGYFSQETFLNYCYKVGDSDFYNASSALQLPTDMTYEALCSKSFTWYPNNTVYTQGTTSDTTGDKWYASAYSDGTLSKETELDVSDYSRDAFGDADGKVDLNVRCVLKLKENLSYGCLSSGGLYYTNALTTHMRDYNLDSDIVKSAKDAGGSLYNVELGYIFKFDGDSSRTIESHYLSAGSSAIMDYISQFMGAAGGSTSGKLSSYSLAALGGNKYPTTVNFYCNNFEQKDLLTAYLDDWNDSEKNDLYKVDTNGFYVGKTEDENGKSITVYYYRDPDTKKFYKVNITEDGYATDYRGDVYKLETNEDNGDSGFYLKLDDTYGEKFTLDGTIKINDSISINAYSLASYVIFKEKFSSTNSHYKDLELVPDKGDYLYRYKNSDDTYEYVMKVQNQSYYKIRLDRNGNLISEKNGYKTYDMEVTEVDGKETVKFYEVEYVKTDDMYIQDTESITKIQYDMMTDADEKAKYTEVNKYYKNTSTSATQIWEEIEKTEYDAITDDANKKIVTTYEKYTYTFQEGSYVEKRTEVSTIGMSNLYMEDEPYNYPNVVKNPTITFNDEEWTFDTKGYYINLTDIYDLFNDFSSFHFDTDTKTITLNDYSGIDFYYKDVEDTDYTYYRVNYEEKDGLCYIVGTDLTAYISASGLEGIDLGTYISDKYIINNDGTLQAVNESFSDSALTVAQMLDLKVIGEELTDLSILEIDESKMIKYTDMIGLIINMVNTLIKVITYALIAFTALSLVVSTVMIGIITYVSVVERTKEIGVIRALGGRKKDVSHLFNAETLIIGFSAGVLGIGITYLLSLVINLIIGHYAGIYTIAALPWYQAIIMIAISVLLTMVAGLIPARSAAKKDPVIALRTE